MSVIMEPGYANRVRHLGAALQRSSPFSYSLFSRPLTEESQLLGKALVEIDNVPTTIYSTNGRTLTVANLA